MLVRINFMQKTYRRLVFFLGFYMIVNQFVSCSHKNISSENKDTNVNQQTGEMNQASDFPNNPMSVIKLEEITNAKIEFGPLVIDPLEVQNRINIKLSNAQIKLISTDKKKDNLLEIKLVKGNPNNCKIKVMHSDQLLFLAENFNADEKCKFFVEIKLYETVPVDLTLGIGSIWASEWDDTINVKLQNGDVDFENIGSLNIKCKECTVAGSGVSGDLSYEIGNGNVGVEGLSQKVIGSTLGDTVLKWNMVNKSSQSSIISRGGDIILSFPKSGSMRFELNVPIGDVYSTILPDLVSVTDTAAVFKVYAETGNVRLGHISL